MKLGDTSLPLLPLPGWGCGLSTGHGVPHAVAGLVSCWQHIRGWSCRFGGYCAGNGLVLSMCCSSPWWQHWWWADTAATTTFATTGVEPVLLLWASLSTSAGSWYHHCGVHYPVAVLVQWSCHHGGRHVCVTPAVVVSPHRCWADHVVVGFTM